AKMKLGMVLVLALSMVAAGAGAAAHQVLGTKQPEAKQEAEPKPASKGTEQAKSKEAKRQIRTDRYGDPLPPGAIARMGTVRFHHGSFLRNLAYSREGKTLVGSSDGEVCVWEAAT